MRAIQLRPILLEDTTLSIRVGVQPAIDIPRSNIASVELHARGFPLTKQLRDTCDASLSRV